jgi:four helix bundle protein
MENKEFSKMLQITPESKIVKGQLTKSGTSIGANYREANRSRSKADFRSRIRICESESSESCYWLEIISDMKWINVSAELAESNELLAIFTAIGKKLISN